MENFCISLTPPTLRRRLLRLGGPETGFMYFFGSPRHNNASPRRSKASPRRTCKSCFESSLPLNLTIIHWTNENPNK